MSKKLNLTLHVWRQKGPSAAGDFVAYPLKDVDDHMSFLEMLDVLNEQLIARRATSPWPSITTAARASAARAG
jgi:hypothetical protein